MKKILIIGAGISGLSLAYRLQESSPDAEVTVLEQAARPGGAAWTLRENGFQVEIGPNGFLDTKPSTVQLARDVHLGEHLVPASDAAGKNRFLLVDGRLEPLPGSIATFLTTDLLSWRGKMAFLRERFRHRPDPIPVDESVDAFARRRAGDEIADRFADALVTGIFAGDPRLLSLPACFPRLAEFEREHGSVLCGFAHAARQRRLEAVKRGEPNPPPGRMWSFHGGMRDLSATLAARLRIPPRYGVAARAVVKDGDPRRPTWHVEGEGQDRWSADALILTCPAYRQAELLIELDAALAEDVAGIPYNRVAVVALGYRREDVPASLDGFGFIAPQKTGRDLLGVQWCSSIFPDRAPDGAVLLRALCGGWQRADVPSWDDGRLLTAVRRELHVAQGIAAPPIFHRIIRWDRAIPQYHVGHLQRLGRIDGRLRQHPGLFLGGNAYRGVALNDCTEQGSILASKALAYLAQPMDARSNVLP